MTPPDLSGRESQDAEQKGLASEEARMGSESRKETFERRYRLLELRERRADRALKQRELELGAGRGVRFTSSQAAVAGAVLALLSAVIGGVIQSYTTQTVKSEENEALIAIERLKADASIKLEQQKQEFAERLERAEFETTLILKAIEASQREDQLRNLKFFLNAGFISDPDGKIAGMDEDAFPSLAPPDAKQVVSPSELMTSSAEAVGKIVVQGVTDDGRLRETKGTSFFVSPDGYAITASYLFEDMDIAQDKFQIRASFASRHSPTVNAVLIAKDDQYGVALIRASVPEDDFAKVKISPRASKVGEEVYVIGYAGDFEQARMESGLIIALSGYGGKMEINVVGEPGYGGAPVFDKFGEVIGMVLGVRFDPVTGMPAATPVIPITYSSQMLAAAGLGRMP